MDPVLLARVVLASVLGGRCQRGGILERNHSRHVVYALVVDRANGNTVPVRSIVSLEG